jgi:excisionase family DNA binding protein
MAEERLTVSVPEAARLLGVSRSTVYELVRRGVLPSVRVSPRRTLLHRARLLAWVDAGGLERDS